MSKEIVEHLRAGTPGYHPGWRKPEHSSWQDEQLSWKKTCYVGDWSFLWDIEVKGPDALKLFRDSGVNSFEKFAIGQAKHLVQCSPIGKVAADGVLMRMADDVFRTQSSTAFYSAYLAENGNYDLSWREIRTFQLQVSGPNALALCEQLAGEGLTDIKFMHFREIRIAGKQVYAVRQGMAGEIGFEFHGDEADKDAVYAEIIAQGASFGIRELGRRTAMINHLEASFPTGAWHYLNDFITPGVDGVGPFIAENFDTHGVVPHLSGSFVGNDIVDYLFTPYELGWGKSVKFDHDFIGREALEKEAANQKRQRVTLEFNSEDVVEIYASLFRDGDPYDYLDIPHPQRWTTWADAVQKDGETVGISMTPGYSFHFRKVLALAVIDIALAEPGTQVDILWGKPGSPQKLIRATVAPAPYKTDNRRVDLSRAQLAAV